MRLKKTHILKIKPMVVTSLLHGAPQLKLEARGALKGVNPLWDFELLIIFSEKKHQKLFLPDCPLKKNLVILAYSNSNGIE